MSNPYITNFGVPNGRTFYGGIMSEISGYPESIMFRPTPQEESINCPKCGNVSLHYSNCLIGPYMTIDYRYCPTCRVIFMTEKNMEEEDMTVEESYEKFLVNATKPEIFSELLRLEELAYAEDGTPWRDRAFAMRKRWKIVSDALKMFRETYIT